MKESLYGGGETWTCQKATSQWVGSEGRGWADNDLGFIRAGEDGLQSS